MTISSLESSPESRKFIFASPVQETLRHDTSRDASMILDDKIERQDEIEVDNDGPIDNPDEDKVDEDKADEDKADEDQVDKDKVYNDSLLEHIEQYKLEHEKLEQECLEQEKELQDMLRFFKPEDLKNLKNRPEFVRLEQERNRIEKRLLERNKEISETERQLRDFYPDKPF